MYLSVDIKKKLQKFSLNINFELTGGTLALLGESGCGKTITLRCIAGLVKPDEGRIILNDRVLFDSEKGINLSIQKRKVGFLFQNYALFPHMTVEENIGYGLKGLNKVEKNKIIDAVLEITQLSELKKSYPHQISGGQQQRIALARALAVNPEILMLDEPFSALDNHLRNLMIKHMKEILENYNGPTIFVTHNMEEAYSLCTDTVIIEKGRSIQQGTTKDIFRKPNSVTSAKVTGCKNISNVQRLSDNTLMATQWNCKINFREPINQQIKHIAIRAHYIYFQEEVTIENSYQCWPVFTSEKPFGTIVYLKLHEKPIDSEDYNLQWDITSKEWDRIKDKPLPWKIGFDEKDLILIE
ncbi:sulfate/molybdate ABC transporter ATP-binding protein [Clostridium cellulovorans]|uniref:ABC transporter related n=1 Tax=Clostridium cellulovorans (strain ATCC 35296 / DSM 3052 / OCM 3 / 743B) TaxID=573061 RepID=D9SWR8_CLOC7|nr:sulfate/molybdate ABC transporter ATP-binding protein [Clostridium cellulovorans]ADL51279.1 ABC transporter related [Clostridium cellulovorans 743B]